MSFETVIGLEVHVQLSTTSKLFCGCSTRYGAPPNSQVCTVCLGYPGALPVLNRRALRYAVRAALAFGGEVGVDSRFDRKNYFYPDLPKGYQISQFDHPVVIGGEVRLSGDSGPEEQRSVVRLVRIHLEEDAGKSVHEGGTDPSGIDLNRCGTPLLEIVTEPDLRSGAAAADCLRTIRDVVRWIGISDANMEEGSLRCDVNVSLRPAGQSDLGTRAEVKNLNSFSNVERAIAAEEVRQRERLERGQTVVQETRLFDAELGITASMRGKEESEDYRYFPDPDLPRVKIEESLIDEERREFPELPRARARRFLEEHPLTSEQSDGLVESRFVADYFEAAVRAGAGAVDVVNWLKGPVRRHLNATGGDIRELSVKPEGLARIIEAVHSERISVASGRSIFEQAATAGDDPDGLLAAAGDQVSDTEELEAWVRAVLAEQPEAAAKVRAGESKPLAYLMGQVMARSRGRANPRRVAAMLKAILDAD